MEGDHQATSMPIESRASPLRRRLQEDEMAADDGGSNWGEGGSTEAEGLSAGHRGLEGLLEIKAHCDGQIEQVREVRSYLFERSPTTLIPPHHPHDRVAGASD